MRDLAPVLIEPDRVIRTIVGLRPFRPSGFVVRRESLGQKTLVHNYGHGGAGFALSWGTAQLAAEQVPAGDAPIALLGGGVVGLSTARVLQERGRRVTIYARALSPDTTSDIAGGRIYPSDACDPAVASPTFLETLWRAAHASYAAFRALPPEQYGIRTLPTYACRESPLPPDSLLRDDSPIRSLLPGLRDLRHDEHPFPYPFVRAFDSTLAEPAIYLPALRRAFERAGGTIVLRNFATANELTTLAEPVVINCTALGAATLFDDREIYPIRGQLTILRAQPEVDYIALPPDHYMFPRRDGIVLGGTFEHRASSTTPDRATEDRILATHARFFAPLGRT
jgi:glycine/D-amino acid oxidase-like deaminating enzyme